MTGTMDSSVTVDFLHGKALTAAIKKLMRIGNIDCAVAFWGEGAEALIPKPRGRTVRLICNFWSFGVCPAAIEKLYNEGVEVYDMGNLHAKVYIGQTHAIVASANASSNGIGLDFLSQAKCEEAGIRISDKEDITEWFEDLRRKSKRVSKNDIKKAKAIWASRPRPSPMVTARSLLAACREYPKLFNNVFIIAYTDTIGPKAKAKLLQIKNKSVPSPNSVIADFRNAWGYQLEEEYPGGSWIVDLDCRQLQPRVRGCSRIPTPAYRVKVDDDEYDLTITIPGSVLSPTTGNRLIITRNEKQDLIRIAPKLLKIDGKVLLEDAIKLIAGK